MPKDAVVGASSWGSGEEELSELGRDNARENAHGMAWPRMAQPILLSQGTALKCFGIKSVVDS